MSGRAKLPRAVQAARKVGAKAAAIPRPPPYPYRPSIVTFMDILGFSEAVRTWDSQRIGSLLRLLGESAEGEVNVDDWPAGLARTIAFSDNVVRVCPIDSENPYGALFHELLSLVHVQAEVVQHGIILRGGMAVGDIHFSGAMIFGPALVRAYELESQFAVHPRIVLDPKVIETYVHNPSMRGEHSIEEDFEYISDLIREGDDGLYHVDYLRAVRTELNKQSDYPSLLLAHRDMITKRASEIESFNSSKKKYIWLARYHNAVAAEVYDDAEGRNLLVDVTALLYPNI